MQLVVTMKLTAGVVFRNSLLVILLSGLLPGLLSGLFISSAHAMSGKDANQTAWQTIREFTDKLNLQPIANSDAMRLTDSLQVSGCSDYPYHEAGNNGGEAQLLNDLREGLQQGLMCLLGEGPMGYLHSYHEQQAMNLLQLLNSEQPKSMQCVRDELFAYAMAASPLQKISNPDLQQRLNTSPRLTILLDTFRLGGLLSQKHPAKTYEVFYKLDKEEITEHLTGKPMRLKGVQRYENLPGLLFHETIHWLGHVHTNLNPDLTFLYETCCFGGSEYIKDKPANVRFQARACDILRDDELWTAHPYKRMRLWHHREYDQLKGEMREHY